MLFMATFIVKVVSGFEGFAAVLQAVCIFGLAREQFHNTLKTEVIDHMNIKTIGINALMNYGNGQGCFCSLLKFET
jgi:hypothetical protein